MDESRQQSAQVAPAVADAASDAAKESEDFTATVAPPAPSVAAIRASELTPEDIQKLVAENAELKRVNIGLEGEKMRNEAVIADLEEANRQNEEYIKTLEAERSRYRSEVSSLKEDRAGWMSQMWVLKKTYNDYTQTIEAYERCCENQAAEIESLKKRLADFGFAAQQSGEGAGETGQLDDDEQPKQPTEPLPIIGSVVEPLESVDAESASAGSVPPAGDDAAGQSGLEDSQPLDLLDSEKLHEALEASAFFEDSEQPPSFSMPKGRLSR